ncbi:hypothetical protein MVLG_00587 [Microbotryum lychnidis-dioicae p1A1 Lamole]|uniref:General negative regulator of transcription subunit n=1 Tax=Microbotryum lychnidis-dioicae (strain p1A1 Lamole / MvSl-1064) TaxID=683840 RepID=U5GZI7_USTV1|nr:hypothetical protein MVLG_00587 [Microbotryum lychnidis-dioicae p1A1 Lamole]|eukprot:KDE09269.1 hypothetical protein MVLG_00587 [Microbotryum lychnidis-dioicae p1A1 Lamole]
MAARKLQTEIERTLKKVSEGVEIFEGIFDKIQTSTNQTQKEKLEVDLKSQIKKLQRLRDQIKTWMTSNDIKDKQPLIDNRKLIETQMERFKACEKEMKTKAFSKEGLSAAAKLDPKEQLKLELCNWITSMVDELSRQVEASEAEVETLQALKKKKDSDRERLEQLETLNERRQWHVNRLELILRLLENGNLQTDAVNDIKEDIAYFVESNTEEDFDEDEGVYDGLNLEEEEEMFQIGGDDLQSSHDTSSIADEPSPAPAPPPPAKKTVVEEAAKSPAKVSKAATAPAITSPPAPAAATTRKPTLDSNTPRPVVVPPPTRSTSGPVPTPRPVPAALPPIRYAAAAAAANASSTSAATTTVATTAASVPAPTSALAPTPLVTSTPSVTSAPAPPPGLASAAPSPTSGQDASNDSTASSEVSRSTGADASKLASAGPSPMLAPGLSPGNASLSSPAPSSASFNGVNGASAAPSLAAASASPAPSFPSLPQASANSSTDPSESAAPAPDNRVVSSAASQEASSQPTRSANEPRLPSSLADLVTSFESAKQKSIRRDNDLGAIHKILDAGFSNVPQPLDAEKPKYYVPRQPYATPNYYPQEPLPQFANPALFAKLDVDTLFYIFYYCQGTYLQFLAAAELKKQSWRFHKQYLTWFQRANEPQQITDEYEQGVYLYFDWEGSWCQRRKGDFRFDYRYLDTD